MLGVRVPAKRVDWVFGPVLPNTQSTRFAGTRTPNTLTIDPDEFGTDREAVRLYLESENIEARPVWKPMHRQPIFQSYEHVGGDVADDLFENGLCLPSTSSLTHSDRERVADAVRRVSLRSRSRRSEVV